MIGPNNQDQAAALPHPEPHKSSLYNYIIIIPIPMFETLNDKFTA
jgi:hypothetical protein